VSEEERTVVRKNVRRMDEVPMQNIPVRRNCNIKPKRSVRMQRIQETMRSKGRQILGQ